MAATAPVRDGVRGVFPTESESRVNASLVTGGAVSVRELEMASSMTRSHSEVWAEWGGGCHCQGWEGDRGALRGHLRSLRSVRVGDGCGGGGQGVVYPGIVFHLQSLYRRTNRPPPLRPRNYEVQKQAGFWHGMNTSTTPCLHLRQPWHELCCRPRLLRLAAIVFVTMTHVLQLRVLASNEIRGDDKARRSTEARETP